MAIVYQHRRKDTNEVFYIGISHEKYRPYSKLSRNVTWKSIVNKHGYEVDILISGCSWEDACKIEKALIKDYGRADLELGPLVNLTEGGDGVRLFREKNGMFGKKHKIDTLKKISENSKLLKHTKESIAKIKASSTGHIKEKKPCEYCGIYADGGNLKRWHGEKCKKKEERIDIYINEK